MNRFDASAWAGIWPFTATRTTSLSSLVASLKSVSVTGALVSPLNAVLGPDPMLANADLLDEVDRRADDGFRVLVAPVLDPSLPGWERDLQQLLAHNAVAAIRIVPNYHGYEVDDEAAVAIAEAVTASGKPLCVQIRMIDERAHHPLMKVAATPVEGVARLAEAVPSARIVVAGVFQAELAAIAPNPNICAELSSVESGDVAAKAIAAMGEKRLLLGTHAPLYEPAVGIAKIERSGMPKTARELIGWRNAAALLDVDLT